ncbi:MAG: lipopolysaccharide biosynthesis protein [Bacillota bacterium]
MRVKNSLLNIIFGLISQVVSLLMGFFVRTVIIFTLGIEYVGVEGLFTSILLLLSLANLGFDTAMLYSLYNPLSQGNTYKIQALINLYKKAYRIIGFIVLGIGLCIFPFLGFLINGDHNIANLNIIYLLFLFNATITYFSVYKHSIIIADQKGHIISKVHTKFFIFSNALQILILLVSHLYVLVLFIQIIIRISENIYISKIAEKLYPFIKNNSAKLNMSEKKDFFKGLYAQSLYKVSGVVINGVDNVVISIYLGIVTVGIYSNYLLILGALSTMLSYIFYSLTASVGNLVSNGSIERKYFIFRVINFTHLWIFGFCAINLIILLNPFLSYWLGKEYLFHNYIVLAIVINFLTSGIQGTCTMFRETTGLFKIGKYRPIIAACINIVLTLLLIKSLGIIGVLIATIISRLCVYFWYDPYLLYKHIFEKPLTSYFFTYAKFMCIIVGISVLLKIFEFNAFSDPLANLILNFLACLIIPNLIFYGFFRKSEEIIYLQSIFKSYVLKKYSLEHSRGIS